MRRISSITVLLCLCRVKRMLATFALLTLSQTTFATTCEEIAVMFADADDKYAAVYAGSQDAHASLQLIEELSSMIKVGQYEPGTIENAIHTMELRLLSDVVAFDNMLENVVTEIATLVALDESIGGCLSSNDEL